MKRFGIVLIFALITATGSHAQDFKMPMNLERLSQALAGRWLAGPE